MRCTLPVRPSSPSKATRRSTRKTSSTAHLPRPSGSTPAAIIALRRRRLPSCRVPRGADEMPVIFASKPAVVWASALRSSDCEMPPPPPARVPPPTVPSLTDHPSPRSTSRCASASGLVESNMTRPSRSETGVRASTFSAHVSLESTPPKRSIGTTTGRLFVASEMPRARYAPPSLMVRSTPAMSEMARTAHSSSEASSLGSTPET